MEKAAIGFALTPGPDIPALRTKLAVLRTHGVDEPEGLSGPALELVDEDRRRMTG